MLLHRTLVVWFKVHPKNYHHQAELAMLDDERCCGTGTCIIDAYGLCWCGQQWDGVKMYRPAMEGAATLETSELIQTAEEADPE